MHANMIYELMKVIFKENNQEAVKEMLEPILNELMKLERETVLNAKHYERNEDRIGYASGYKPKQLKTQRFGVLELLHPQARGLTEPFHSSMFDKYQRSEKALITTIGEMYFKGVSTRKISKLYGKVFNTSISPQMVSNAAKEIDEVITFWKNRKIEEEIPIMIIDALYTKVRINNIVTTQSVYIVSVIQSNGKRRVLDFMIADSENESSYREFFANLKHRGLKKVDMIISDAHKGLKNAINKEFRGAIWQKCRVHFMRELLKKLRKKEQTIVAELLKTIYNSRTIEEARYHSLTLEKALEKMNHPKLADNIWEKIEETVQYLSYKKVSIRTALRKLSTSNFIERLNGEIKRRLYSIRIFPNKSSLLRVVGTILLEQDEEWESGRNYILFKKEQDIREFEESILEFEREKYSSLIKKENRGTYEFAEIY